MSKGSRLATRVLLSPTPTPLDSSNCLSGAQLTCVIALEKGACRSGKVTWRSCNVEK